MRLLVTGGAGFIGANFVHSAVRERPGVSVTVLDALTYAGCRESLRPVEESIRLVEGDVTDEPLVDRLVAESDAVVHFAAETHVDNALAGPAVFVRSKRCRHVLGAGSRSPTRGAPAPHLHRRGVRRPAARRWPAIHRGDPVQPLEPILGDQGVGRPAGAGVGAVVRPARDDLELLQQLRALSAHREVHSRARSPTS